MKLKSIIYVIIGILITAGILIISLTEFVSENWFIGLALLGLSFTIIVVIVIINIKKQGGQSK